ncbi:MAG: hypothetical protein JW860_04545 [Sedimentisphaerales bacterium]|nr:hypothetical protein [Sedimentisphaerales bacterium]
MFRVDDRRHADRVYFSWPIWYGHEDNGNLFQGRIVDLNNTHVSFMVENHLCPAVGQHIFTRFSFPRNSDNRFEMDGYLHWSEVMRVDESAAHLRRVAVRLHQPVCLETQSPEELEATAGV